MGENEPDRADAIDPAVAHVVSGAAWAEFCDAMKDMGQFVLDHSEAEDVIDRVEGFRYLSRLMRGGLESFLEVGNTKFPTINRLPNQVKIGSDNPDAYYQSVNIDGRYDYRVWGTRGTVHYLGFGAYTGNFGAGADRLGFMGALDGGDLQIDADGRFEVIFSQDPHDGNWVPLKPEPGIIAIRQFHLDRSTEQIAQLQIERIGDPEPLHPVSPVGLHNALQGVHLFVTGVSDRFTTKVEQWARERPNTLETDPDMGTKGWGDENQIFRHGYWALEPGQALVISFTPPPCFYWNFQLDNLWMESLDYRFLPVTVNKHTAQYEPDGSVRIIVADADPGGGNWMDTAGHRHGAMGLRWNQAEFDVDARCEIVDATSLRD
ncbi:MAG: hypothetical protein HKN26_13955 [Acidimicrobiales bacterium]|nr:hypothetical protein [Acidimicrobiales bacterium]